MEIDIAIKDNISPELQRLVKQADDLQPVMRRVESEIIEPEAVQAWSGSGLHSRTGALRAAIVTWHGKVSAGVTLKAKGGRKDVGLIFPKAATHMYGRKKFSSKQGAKSKRRSPWGDIPARPFFAEAQDIERRRGAIITMIEEHLRHA